MRILRFLTIGLFIVVATAYGWHAFRLRQSHQAIPRSAQALPTQPVGAQSQAPGLPGQSGAPSSDESASHFGPFTITGKDYTVDLETRKVSPGSNEQQNETVVAIEIRDATGAVQYRRTFPYVEAKEDYFESWSASARLLTGTNGTGLLVTYNDYSEPSAPEEEPTVWFQVFGVLDGKLASFGPPLQIQGGPMDEYVDDKTYKAARPLDPRADEVEFKVWSGHCRLIYPVRVDWSQGKLTPVQECAAFNGALTAGCQYKVVPEDKLYPQGVTFVRLWPGPDEQSGQPVKTVVKMNSKVDLLIAQIATKWADSNPAANAESSLENSGGFGVTPDAELWLKVRIDGKEGWMHSEEDFVALGLPEDE